MCVIVDNDVVARVLVKGDAAFVPLNQAIWKKRHKLIHGGKLTKEYIQNHAIRSVLRLLDEKGLSRIVGEAQIVPVVTQLVENNSCRSNDEHVIALAQVSNTRLLCSLDEDLIEDFKDKALIDKPRGKVYKGADHRKLVDKACKACCGQD